MLLPMLLATPPSAVVWYGPKTVAFNLETSGNPYDPVQNDVRVEFKGPNGAVEGRLAYFDEGTWKATLLAHGKGEYKPTVFVNGKRGVGLPAVTLSAIKPFGFVRLAGMENFRLDDGSAFWPLGHNLAWAGGGVQDLPAYLKTMGSDGLNWARIWANHWDGKNPYWKEGETPKSVGTMIPSVLKKWDAIVEAADAAGVRFQLTLFHHGPWSSRVNSNWPENPWNVKNGGFLKSPSEFFTNARAKALAREWLRYVVARWGHSPSIMAWELFNEVQWCDPHYEKGDATLGAWHDEMFEYLKSIDPYHHLLTTSSDLDLPIYRKADYYQPHTYPPSVEGALAAAPRLDKPLFFGELGPGQLDGSRPVQVEAIRDGIWTGLLALHAGAGQFWSWDRIPRDDLRGEFARGARLMREIGPDHAGFSTRTVALDSGTGGDFAGLPGTGWGTSTQFAYRLPEEASQLGRLSSFLQGRAHPEMQPQPVSFTFRSAKPIELSVEVAGVADGGGELRLEVDGRDGFAKAFPAGTKLGSPFVAKIAISAGAHTLTLRNGGADWVSLGRITIPGISPRATARAISNGTRAVLRIKGSRGLSVALDGLGLKDGSYRAHVADLDGGDATVPMTVKGGKMGRLSLPGADTVVIVR